MTLTAFLELMLSVWYVPLKLFLYEELMSKFNCACVSIPALIILCFAMLKGQFHFF